MISRLQQEKLQTSSADRFHKHLTFHHSIFLSKIKIWKNGKIFIRKKVVIHNRKKERIFRADKKMIQHICNKKPLKNGIKNYGFSCKKKFFVNEKKLNLWNPGWSTYLVWVSALFSFRINKLAIKKTSVMLNEKQTDNIKNP